MTLHFVFAVTAKLKTTDQCYVNLNTIFTRAAKATQTHTHFTPHDFTLV